MLRKLLTRIGKRVGEKSKVSAELPMTENERLHHQISQRKKEIVEFLKTLEKL